MKKKNKEPTKLLFISPLFPNSFSFIFFKNSIRSLDFSVDSWNSLSDTLLLTTGEVIDFAEEIDCGEDSTLPGVEIDEKFEREDDEGGRSFILTENVFFFSFSLPLFSISSNLFHSSSFSFLLSQDFLASKSVLDLLVKEVGLFIKIKKKIERKT
jgi:hypothetical protein